MRFIFTLTIAVSLTLFAVDFVKSSSTADAFNAYTQQTNNALAMLDNN